MSHRYVATLDPEYLNSAMTIRGERQAKLLWRLNMKETIAPPRFLRRLLDGFGFDFVFPPGTLSASDWKFLPKVLLDKLGLSIFGHYCFGIRRQTERFGFQSAYMPRAIFEAHFCGRAARKVRDLTEC